MRGRGGEGGEGVRDGARVSVGKAFMRLGPQNLMNGKGAASIARKMHAAITSVPKMLDIPLSV